ncbi:MAG: argininosuccinate lyase [Halodesulfurarchaeum sp.]
MSDGDSEDPVVRRERFSGGPARGFLSSLAADERIFAADLAVDTAHVVMLEEQGIIETDVTAEILEALSAVESAGFDSLPEGEDVHEAIETAVIDAVGPDGGTMHTARSRNDEVATCIRYRLREDLLSAAEATIAFREALTDVATSHTETVMPGYTHLQPAQPTTVGHFLASYEQAVSRDTGRLFYAVDRTNRSPLGAAAFAGTPFDIDRERTASLLGFDGVLENSMDAVSTRDFLLESVGALANLAVTLSGLAEDLVVFANRGFVELDDAYSSTSSIMPQKKNPDTLELIRGTAGDAAASFNGLFATLKGLPRAYNRDLQRATPHVWEAVDDLVDATDVAAGAVETATWNDDALSAAADEGFSTATGVADALAMAGLPFRSAHEIVATAAEQGGDLEAIRDATESVTGRELDSFLDPSAVEDQLDPATSVAERDSSGGPSPGTLERSLSESKTDIAADSDAVADRRESIAEAQSRLESVVATYV